MKGIRLTDKQKKKIVADYVQNESYSETARMNNVSVETIRRVVNKSNEFKKLSEAKKEENNQSTIEYMTSQHETKKRIIDKLLKAIETKSENIDMFTNIKDLATAYGIIVDKELKVLELQKARQDINNGLDKVQQLLDQLEKEAHK